MALELHSQACEFPGNPKSKNKPLHRPSQILEVQHQTKRIWKPLRWYDNEYNFLIYCQGQRTPQKKKQPLMREFKKATKYK